MDDTNEQTFEQTRARVHAAVLTASVSARPGPRSVGVIWPTYAHDWADLLEHVASGTWRRASAPVRFVPTPTQLDDMLIALSWLQPHEGVAKLEPHEWDLLFLRAWQEWRHEETGQRTSWTFIAKVLRKSARVNRSGQWWRISHRGLIRRANTLATDWGRSTQGVCGFAKSGDRRANVAGRMRAA